MPKIWQEFDDDCMYCGGAAVVLTDSGFDNLAYDGDTARCADCGCPGQVIVDEGDEGECVAHILWHDEAGCSCKWCQENL